MFVDARQIESGSVLANEVCIIGGGVAGLTIARELAARNTPCCVIESGGFEPDNETRDLYRGESVGLPYRFADGCRSRYLGGSSNCWGGWCRPMDPLDYERRSWIPHSGWPFGPEELAPYYDRARSVLQLGQNNYDTSHWTRAIARPDVRAYPLDRGELIDGISQFSPPLRAGKVYRAELRDSNRIQVLLHANVTNILCDSDIANVEQVEVQTLQGVRFTVRARHFVLATGGIENTRLLLSSNSQASTGLGNCNDLVGRYFMDHPRVTSGWVHLQPQWQRNKLYDNKFQYQNDAVAANGIRIAAQFAATPEAQERYGITNARVSLGSIFPGEYDAAAEAIRQLKLQYDGMERPDWSMTRNLMAVARHPILAAGFVAARLWQPQFLIRGVRMQVTVEATPDPESRVTLSDARDQLGMRRVRVNWRLDDTVRRTFDRMLALMRQELESRNIARIDLDPPIEGGEWPSTFEREGTWHHMGTTRMHDSPREGVVDRDCRVHGMNNFYIGGSSVFPCGSTIYPTITLTALALRLAGHLHDRMNRV
jgi:choline dehydrogenase-like flavoprotein